MITTAKSVKKTIGNWRIVFILVIPVYLLVSLIQYQEAYAETKKISGTFKAIVQLSFCARHSVLSSADPDWNNARFFSASSLEFTKPGYFNGYSVITHPSGDQTFIKFTDKMISSDGHRETGGSETTGETEGFFMKGTGKF